MMSIVVPIRTLQSGKLNRTLVQSTPQPRTTKTKTKRMTAATKTFPKERSRPAIGLDRWLFVRVARTLLSACGCGLLNLLRDGDGVTVPVFKGNFLHAVELVGDGHRDFRLDRQS